RAQEIRSQRVFDSARDGTNGDGGKALDFDGRAALAVLVQTDFRRGWRRDRGSGYRASAFLASGKADALSGKFFAVPEDPAKVVERADEVKRDDLYTLRMRGLSS